MSKIKILTLPINQLYPDCKITIKQRNKKRWLAESTLSFVEGNTEIQALKNLADKFRLLASQIDDIIELDKRVDNE